MRALKILFPALSLLCVAPPVSSQVFVRTATLEAVVVDRVQRAPAEVVPLNDSSLAAEVNAVVSQVAADVGQAVAQGELLLALDDTDFRLRVQAADAALTSARARFEEAHAKLERARRLGADNYVSEDELLTRETALAVGEADIHSAEAQLAIARRELEKCRVLAPFDGVVRSRSAQLGAYVTVGSPLVRLTQTDRIEVDAEVPVNSALELENAVEAWFESRGRNWPLRLLRLSPVVEAERRARLARFAFQGEAAAAGQSGQVAWRVAGGLLPANLLSRRDGRLGVFLLEDGQARFVPLPDAEEGRPVPVSLPPDSQVVVQGQDRLQDGDPATAH